MSYGKFAPSKDDIIGALMHFFGAPASPEKLADYSEHHAATYHFPDAFTGSNVRLRDVMSNLILRSPQVWQTSLGLPFQQLEGIFTKAFVLANAKSMAPATWWATYGKHLPRLSSVARRVLAPSGALAAVVHQYDRYERIVGFVEDRWPYPGGA